MQENPDAWIKELLELFDEEEKMTEKQIRILRAAVEIFSEKGYASSSTSEIAQKAGVAEGTIFRHFKTKNDLLLSIVTPMMTKIIAPLVMKDFIKVLNADHMEMADFFRAVMRNRIDFARKNMPILKIFLQEIPFQQQLRDHFKEQVSEKIFNKAKSIIEHYQKEGKVVPYAPPHIIRFAATVVIGYVLFRFLIAPELEWDDEKDTDLTIDLIMYGLSPREPSHSRTD